MDAARSLLLKALSATLVADKSVRDAAEEFLRQCRLQDDYLQPLLSIVGTASIPLADRTAAAILLKNEIRQGWGPATKPKSMGGEETTTVVEDGSESAETGYYSEKTRTDIRSSILPVYAAISNRDASLKDALEEAVSQLILHDFPNPWDTPLSFTVECVQQRENVQVMISGLCLVRRLIYRYQMMSLEEEESPKVQAELSDLMQRVCPLLLQTDLGEGFFADHDRANITKMICKDYHHLATLEVVMVSDYLANCIDPFLSFLARVIRAPIPAEVLAANASAEELNDCVAVKAKKWALQTVRRFFTKFASSKTLVNGASSKSFAKAFSSKWALSLLETIIQVERAACSMESKDAERYVPPRLQCIMLGYFTQALELSGAYKILKPHVEFLLTSVIFPLLCYKEEDVEEWDTDPLEYYRKQNDFRYFINPRDAAADFLKSVMRFRGKDFLEPVAAFVQNIFTEFRTAPPESKVFKSILSQRKDGAVYMLGIFAERLTGKKRNVKIETVIYNELLPDLNRANGDPFLRLRAAWAIERFLDPDHSVLAQKGSFENEQQLLQVFKALLVCCTDPEIPVKLVASSATSVFFATPVPTLQTFIRQNGEEIVDLLLAVVDNLEDESAIGSLACMIEHYEDLVPPLAVKLIDFLSQALFKALLPKGESVDGTGGETTLNSPTSDFSHQSAAWAVEGIVFTVTHICRTINTIISILSEPKFNSILEPVLPKLAPFFEIMLSPWGMEFVDEAMETLGLVTFYIPRFNPILWQYYERLYQMVCGGSTSHLVLSDESVCARGWAIDELGSMLAAIDNYLYQDKQTFLTGKCVALGKSYKEMYLGMYEKALFSDVDADGPANAIQMLWLLVDSFCENIAAVDDMVVPAFESMWKYALSPTMGPVGSCLEASICLTLCTLAYASPTGFFALCNRLDVTEKALTAMLNPKSLKSEHAKKAFILAFVRIVRLARESPAQIPPQAQLRLTSFLTDVAREAMELIKLKSTEQAESSTTSEGDSEQELDETDDAKPDSFLSKAVLKKLCGSEEKAEDEDEDNDDDFGIDIESNLSTRISPLDAVKEMVVLQNFINEFSLEISACLGACAASDLARAIETEIQREEAVAAAEQQAPQL